MRKTSIIVLATLFLTSCGQTKSGVTGGLITSWKDTISGSVDNSVRVTKSGEACSKNILGIVATGDSSVEAAKKNGRISNVSYADTNYMSILGLFQKGCTVVKGN